MARKPFLILALTSALLLAACGTSPDIGGQSDRDLLHSRAQASLDDFKRADPTLEPILNSAYAYAIFPHVVTGAVGVGGAHGDGEVYQNGHFVGYADISQGSIGIQLGGQHYAELVIFKTESPFVDFTHSTLAFDARASAIAASSGAAGAADYSRGTLIFSMPEGGLMFQAAIGGQKFRYSPDGNR